MLELLDTAHRDMEKMKLRERTKCYWRNIYMYTDHFVTACLACEYYKTSKQKGPFVIREEPDLAFQQVAVRKFVVRIGKKQSK